MPKNLMRLLDEIVAFADDQPIGLPAEPEPNLANRSRAETAMAVLRDSLGPKIESDYFKSSEARFSRLVEAALDSLPSGGYLLDVGNAPGYLAQALYEVGFRIKGVNLSREWDSTYPSIDYLGRFEVLVFDIESGALPFPSDSFDGIIFTEVLEHIAIRKPEDVLAEFFRVLKPGGSVIFSTPNVCNASNIIALLKGRNIFWDPKIFYGSLDRHNREWTPLEVKVVFESVGFERIQFFGINDHANWRTGASADMYQYLEARSCDSALLRNTILGVFRKPG